jgi:hypothetical protein
MKRTFIWIMMIMVINRMPLRSYIFILISNLLILTSNTGLLVAQARDFELWSGVSIETQHFNRISFELEEEIRFRNNAGNLDSYFTDAGISVDLWKGFTIAGYYRFVRRNEQEERYSKIHRYYFDLNYRKKIGRFELSARTRYQTRYKDYFSSELGYIPERYSRNKITVIYDIYRSALEPRLWFEFYYQLNNPHGNTIDKIRFAPELRYSINLKNELKLFYMVEKEYYVDNPAVLYVLCIGYIYKI